MKSTSILRLVSAATLIVAIGLIAWGGYGIATFPEAEGSGYDPRFFVFDNGYYPVFWGGVLLLAWGALRLWIYKSNRAE